MRAVEEGLVVGVAVDGGHHPAFDAEGLVQYLHHRGDAVGGAGCRRDDPVAVTVVGPVVDAHDDGGVDVLARRGQQHRAGAALQVQGGGVAVAEANRGLDDVRAVLGPAQRGRVAFGGDGDAPAVDGEGGFVVLDVAPDVPERRVVLQQMGRGGRGGDVVDGDHLDVLDTRFGAVEGGAQIGAAGTAEAVDADTYGHGGEPLPGAAVFRRSSSTPRPRAGPCRGRGSSRGGGSGRRPSSGVRRRRAR